MCVITCQLIVFCVIDGWWEHGSGIAVLTSTNGIFLHKIDFCYFLKSTFQNPPSVWQRWTMHKKWPALDLYLTVSHSWFIYLMNCIFNTRNMTTAVNEQQPSMNNTSNARSPWTMMLSWALEVSKCKPQQTY